MRVLITGGTGCVGRHRIAPLIEKKHEVHCAGKREIDMSEGPEVEGMIEKGKYCL